MNKIEEHKKDSFKLSIANLFALSDDCLQLTIDADVLGSHLILASRSRCMPEYRFSVRRIASILKVSPDRLALYLSSNGYDLPNPLNEDVADLTLGHYGVSLAAKMNQSLLRVYYIESTRNYDKLSSAEKSAFNNFKKRYSKTGCEVKSWYDIDTDKIKEEFYDEVGSSYEDLLFMLFNGKVDKFRVIDQVRESEFYNRARSASHIVNGRRRQFRSVLETFIEHRYHIFTSDGEDEDAVSSNFIISYSY